MILATSQKYDPQRNMSDVNPHENLLSFVIVFLGRPCMAYSYVKFWRYTTKFQDSGLMLETRKQVHYLIYKYINPLCALNV